jgi:transposase
MLQTSLGQMGVARAMETKIKPVEILPLVKHYMEALGLARLFDKFVPNRNGAEIAPAQVLCMLVMNLMVSAKPLYRVEDWLHDYLDGLGEQRVAAAKYNDDRLVRSLDQLFGADRGSLLTELSAKAIELHQLATQIIHNDTTSVTFLGAYEQEDPQAVKLRHGYNKDHRPDCKQIVFGLNTTADGQVPISYQLYDGNQADVTTHRPNWQHLRELLDQEDFIYVADSKLCAQETLASIARHGGRYITVVPRNVREVKDFLQRVRDGEEIVWQDHLDIPDSRKAGRMQTYRIHVGEMMAAGGRLLWVHSAAKAHLEHNAREQRIAKAQQALEKLASGLNQRMLKTREQIEAAVKKATHGAQAYLTVTLDEERTRERVPLGCGRPGPNTRYRDIERVRYSLTWQRHDTQITQAQRTDGLFPLTDNTDLDPVAVLRTYKNQPYLEKRFSTKKSVLEVAPVFLKTPRRIEAMMLLYFVALMLVSLIERRIRLDMAQQHMERLPMRPGGMHTSQPTWRTIMDSFHGVHLASIERCGKVIQTTLKGLHNLQQQILRLLKVPITVYTSLRDGWWRFALE